MASILCTGEAYDWMIDQIFRGTLTHRRRLALECDNVAGSSAVAACVTRRRSRRGYSKLSLLHNPQYTVRQVVNYMHVSVISYR